MSFIEFIGGAERVDVYKRLESFDLRLSQMNTKVFDISQRLSYFEKELSNIESNMKKINEGFENYRKLHPLTEEAANRITEIELLQKHLQYSNQKALNDISDLKKELYNLYQHNIVSRNQEEAHKFEIATNEEIKLFDILKERLMIFNPGQKASFVRMLKENNLETLQDLLDIPYEDLNDLSYCDQKNLAILQCIYEEYE